LRVSINESPPTIITSTVASKEPPGRMDEGVMVRVAVISAVASAHSVTERKIIVINKIINMFFPLLLLFKK
jgi:hypothetical protein